MAAFYSELDPFAAAWLRELIGEGLIPDGVVDERDIRTIAADDLRGYRSVHLFAGVEIGNVEDAQGRAGHHGGKIRFGWAIRIDYSRWPHPAGAWAADVMAQCRRSGIIPAPLHHPSSQALHPWLPDVLPSSPSLPCCWPPRCACWRWYGHVNRYIINIKCILVCSRVYVKTEIINSSRRWCKCAIAQTNSCNIPIIEYLRRGHTCYCC